MGNETGPTIDLTGDGGSDVIATEARGTTTSSPSLRETVVVEEVELLGKKNKSSPAGGAECVGAGGRGSWSGSGSKSGGGGGSNNLGMMMKGEAEARAEGKFAVFRIMPPVKNNNNNLRTPEERHFHLVEKKVADSLSNRASPAFGAFDLRKIQSVEYIVNPELEAAFEREKKEMKARLRDEGRTVREWRVVRGVGTYVCRRPKCEERMVFHGTSFESSEAIMRENFRLDKMIVQKPAQVLPVYRVTFEGLSVKAVVQFPITAASSAQEVLQKVKQSLQPTIPETPMIDLTRTTTPSETPTPTTQLQIPALAAAPPAAAPLLGGDGDGDGGGGGSGGGGASSSSRGKKRKKFEAAMERALARAMEAPDLESAAAVMEEAEARLQRKAANKKSEKTKRYT